MLDVFLVVPLPRSTPQLIMLIAGESKGAVVPQIKVHPDGPSFSRLSWGTWRIADGPDAAALVTVKPFSRVTHVRLRPRLKASSSAFVRAWTSGLPLSTWQTFTAASRMRKFLAQVMFPLGALAAALTIVLGCRPRFGTIASLTHADRHQVRYHVQL